MSVVPLGDIMEKRRKRNTFWKSFFCTLFAAVIIFAGICFLAAGYFHGKMNYNEIPDVSAEPLKEEGVTNILLIGNDSRTQGDDGRSDAMILLSISGKTGTIHLTSLLRDIYVDIPGYQGNRLNAAYAYGGAELLMETIGHNFDIEVNRYMLVNFQAFANLIDAAGGVELEVTNEEVQYINGYLVEYNMLEGKPEGTDYLDPNLSGMLHLNGPQALAYCRNRYIGTDFGRTERQRKVLTAAIKNAPTAILKNPKELMEGVLGNITTNLTKGEVSSLLVRAPLMLGYEIVQGTVPVEGSYSGATIRGMSVLEIDFEKNKQYLRTEVYGERE